MASSTTSINSTSLRLLPSFNDVNSPSLTIKEEDLCHTSFWKPLFILEYKPQLFIFFEFAFRSTMSSPTKKNPNTSPSKTVPLQEETSPPPLPGYTRSGLRFTPPSVRSRSVAQMRRIRGCTGGAKLSFDCDGSGVSSTEKPKEVVPEGSKEVIVLDESDDGCISCSESLTISEDDEDPSTGPGSLVGNKRVRFEPSSPIACSSSEDEFWVRFY
ncbi:unnamed protein product [Amaranthus hypochondriacus]